MLHSLLDKLPNAHPLLIGGGGAVAVETISQLPSTNTITSVVQLVIGIVTIFKLIFPKKEKKQNDSNLKN
jgi:hypothetical protein